MKRKIGIILIGIMLCSTISGISFADVESHENNNSNVNYITNLNMFLENQVLINNEHDKSIYKMTDTDAVLVRSNINDKLIKLEITDSGITDVLLIAPNTMYFNGKEFANNENENKIVHTPSNVISRASTKYRYSETPSLKGPYTKFVRGYQCANILFPQEIGSLSMSVFISIIAIECPAAALGAVALQVKSAYDKKNIKNLSFKAKVYYSQAYPSGWHNGTFCEQHVVLWYGGLNYTGTTKYTISYKVGYVI